MKNQDRKTLRSIHKGEIDLSDLRTEEEADEEFDEAYNYATRKRFNMPEFANNLLTQFNNLQTGKI